ncbi:MAG: transglycosylase SLT domain-containing protein [Pseudomonadota bacterium]
MAGIKALRVFVAVICAAWLSPAYADMATPRVKPPAPGPQYLSRLDHARLSAISSSLERKAYSLALAELEFVEDPIARSLGRWLYYMEKDPELDIADAGAFITAHRDWPAIARIQSFVEKQIDDATPQDVVLAFFANREPRTGVGKVQLARAYLATGREADANALIKDAWINQNFAVGDERRLLTQFGDRLTKDDHAKRVDRLLWSRQVTNARRVFPKLAKRDRRMAEARAALLLGAASGSRLYNALAEDEKLDSGVLHAAVRYYRRRDDQQYAISLAARAPDSPDALRNTDRWWTERRLLLQRALKDGRFASAYRLAAHHGMSEGGDFADAEFVAGWIALRFLDAPERATIHFKAFTGSVATPISLARGYYWLGRAAQAQGDDGEARAYFESASEHHYSYYGQLAAEQLGGPALARRFEPEPSPSPEDKARFEARPAVAAMQMLSDLNLDYPFMVFAYHIDDALDRPDEYRWMAKLTNGEGAPHLTVRAGKVAALSGAFAPEVSYPLVFVPEEAKAYAPPEMILGLSRQESEFNPRAYSSAGARGVMQLIPSTAQITARKEGLPYRRSALLNDPIYNMTIGAAHLSHLLDRFDGSMIMTFAGYNAGAHRVDRWVEDFGDPRTGEVDPVDWVELIPFSETRNYVQRVLENIQVYRGRINDAPIPGALSADLDRGGAPARAGRKFQPSAVLATRAAGEQYPLADLPARTALLADAFETKRLAALAGGSTEQVAAPAEITSTVAPVKNRKQRPERRRSTAPARKPVKPVTTPSIDAAANLKMETSASESDVAPAPNAEAKIAPAISDTRTDEPLAPGIPPGKGEIKASQPSAPVATPMETPAATAQTTVATDDVTLAAPEGSVRVADVRNETTIAGQGDSFFTTAAPEKIIDRAARRLEITDQKDELAAAIARGLAQLEAETAVPATDVPAAANPDDPTETLRQTPDGAQAEDACAESEPSDASVSAANLNLQMAAALTGETDCPQ